MNELLKKILPYMPLGSGLFLLLAVAAGTVGAPLNLDEVNWPQVPAMVSLAAEPTTDATKDSTEETATGSYTDGVYTGSGNGYGGTTKVQVTVSESQMTEIKILSHQDTTSYFNIAKSKIIPSILSTQTWEVDGVSGATYSSRGIKEAVCNAMTGQEFSSALPEKSGSGKSLSDSDYQVTAWKDGCYVGSASGFGGKIKVQVTIKDGKIISIKVLSHDGETPSYYAKGKGIISRILKKQTPNVDTISGATYTSGGIREAVKNALRKAEVSKKKKASNNTKTPNEKGSSETDEPMPDGKPADGTYQSSALCSQDSRFNYMVEIISVFKDGVLQSISMTNTDNGSNKRYIDKAWNVLEHSILQNQTGNVDVVSGATYTSQSIKKAYKDTYRQAVEVGGGKVDESTGHESGGSSGTDAADQTEESSDENTTQPEDSSDQTPRDGSYTVEVDVNPADAKKSSQKNQFYSYSLRGTVVFKDGKLSGIKDIEVVYSDDIDDEYEDDAYYTNRAASGMVSKMLQANNSNVDTVSGATCSCEAIKRLYKKAFEKAASED